MWTNNDNDTVPFDTLSLKYEQLKSKYNDIVSEHYEQNRKAALLIDRLERTFKLLFDLLNEQLESFNDLNKMILK